MSYSTVHEAQAAVAALERDNATFAAAARDLVDRLPALRAERIEAARAMLIAGASRKAWQAALQAEQEGHAMLADMDDVGRLLDRELVQARYRVERAKHEGRLAGLESRLRRVATENVFVVPEGAEFLRDVTAAYEWLSTVGRTAGVDRKHAHTYWLDKMSDASGHQVSTQAFIAAALCHGDIAVEMGEHAPSFGIIEGGSRPPASVALTGDPTPSTNRALITKAAPAYAR
jgi:hypothetical protein